MGRLNNAVPPQARLDPVVAAEIEILVKETMQKHKVPGIAIGIVKDGLVEYSHAIGVADVETQQTVTPESVYVMMSVAKQFVAAATMQLVEKGKIDLNAPVIDHLPYFKLADPRYKAVTIRQMLSHTSGMPALDMPSIIGWWRGASIEEDDVSAERYVRNMGNVSLQFEPGEGFSYSDMAFDVLGQVITKVSGQSFEDYIHQHIFTPLGMEHSTFLMADVPPELLVQPHVLGEGGTAVKADVFPYTRWHAPSTDLFSNVPDMTRWMLANLNNGKLEHTRILGESSHEQVWTEHTSTGGMRDYFGSACSAYGYGWFIGALEGYQVMSHSGADLGFHANVLLVPDKSLGIVAMGNNFHSYNDPTNFYAIELTVEAMKILLMVHDS
jgi:CubicO group peptidase (beta-lactamase class C family)